MPHLAPALLLAAAAALPAQRPDSIGDGGPATAAVLVAPAGLAVAPDGTIFVSERAAHRIRRIDGVTGMVTTVAGAGRPGDAGDGGPARLALLSTPTDLALDARGRLYVAEAGSHRVRRIDPVTGRIETFAGTGARGFSGDGGPASEAALAAPFGVTVDAGGNVWIADTDNHRIRRVDAVTGVIETVAGNGERGFGGDGGPATAASLARPHRTTVTREGDLVIGDSFNHRIRRVDARTGVIRTVVGTGRFGAGGDGGPATGATITYSGGVAVDSAGRLVYTDVAAHRVRRVDPGDGRISTVAGTGRWDFGGDGGPAERARFHLPGVVTVAPDGDLLVADMWNGRVRRISAADGRVTTVAGSRETPATPAVGFHFHHDDEAIRAALDAPVAGSATDGSEVVSRRLRVPGEAGAHPVEVEVVRPAGAPADRPLPVVVLVHGATNYAWDPLGWGGLRSWARRIAGRGLAAAIVSHGLGSAPGSLAAASRDVSAAVAALNGPERPPGVDGSRACLLSFAGGSTLVAPYLPGTTPAIRCAVLFSPHASLDPPALWDWYLEAPETRERHTPARRLSPDAPPLFLAMGLRDRPALTGPFEALVDAARTLGIDVEVARHPDGGPDFERLLHDETSVDVVERALDFLARRLGGEAR